MKLDINISTSFIGTTDTMIPNLVAGEVGVAKGADFSAILQESAFAQIPVSESSTENNGSASSDLMIDIPAAAKLIHSLKTGNEQAIVTAPTTITNNTESNNNTVYFPFQSSVEPNKDIKNNGAISTSVQSEQEVSSSAGKTKSINGNTEKINDYITSHKEEETIYTITDKSVYTENIKDSLTYTIEEIQNTLRAHTKSKVQVRLLNDEPDDIQVRVDISATSEKEIPAIIDAIIGTIWMPMQKQEISALHSTEQGIIKNDSDLHKEIAEGESTNFRTVLENNIKTFTPEQKDIILHTKEENTGITLTDSILTPIKKEELQKNTTISVPTNKGKSVSNNSNVIITENTQTVQIPQTVKETGVIPLQENTPSRPISAKHDAVHTQKMIEAFVEHIFPTEVKAVNREVLATTNHEVVQNTIPKQGSKENALQNISTKTGTQRVPSIVSDTENIVEYIIPEEKKVNTVEKPKIVSTQTKLPVQETPEVEKNIQHKSQPPSVRENIAPKAEIKGAEIKDVLKQGTLTQSQEKYPEEIPDENIENEIPKIVKNITDRGLVEKSAIHNGLNNEKTPIMKNLIPENEAKAIAKNNTNGVEDSINIKSELQEIPKNSTRKFANTIPAYITEHSGDVIADEKRVNNTPLYTQKNKIAPNDEHVYKEYDTAEGLKSVPKVETKEDGMVQKNSVLKTVTSADNTVMKPQGIRQTENVEIDTLLDDEYIAPKGEVKSEITNERKNVVISYTAKETESESKNGKSENTPKNNMVWYNRHIEVNDVAVSDTNTVKSNIEVKNNTFNNVLPTTQIEDKTENIIVTKDEKNKGIPQKAEPIIENKTVYSLNSEKAQKNNDLTIEDVSNENKEYNVRLEIKSTVKAKNEEENIAQFLNAPAIPVEETDIVMETKSQAIDKKNNIGTVATKQTTIKSQVSTPEREYVTTAHNVVEPKADSTIEQTDTAKNKEQAYSQKNTDTEKRTVNESGRVSNKQAITTPSKQENTDETIVHSSPEPKNNEIHKTIVKSSDNGIHTSDIVLDDEVVRAERLSEQKANGVRTAYKEIPTQETNKANGIKPVQVDNKKAIVENTTPIEKQESKKEPVLYRAHSNILKDDGENSPIHQAEKEEINNIAVKENSNGVKTERKPIAQEQKSIVRESTKVENKIVANTENNTEIMETEDAVVSVEKNEVENVQKDVTPQKRESVTKSVAPEQNTEIHIPATEEDIYIPTEKHKQAQGNIVSNEIEADVNTNEVPLTREKVIENGNKKVVDAENEYVVKEEVPIVHTPKDTVKDMTDIGEETSITPKNKENPKVISQRSIVENDKNTVLNESAYSPKLKPIIEKNESQKTTPLVPMVDTHDTKKTGGLSLTIAGGEPVYEQSAMGEIPKKSTPKNDIQPEKKSQIFVSDSVPLREKDILKNEDSKIYDNDTANTKNEEIRTRTYTQKENESVGAEEKQIDGDNLPLLQIPLITDNANVYVFKNEEKSNSAIVITNNEIDTAINTENIPSTVSALHTIIEKASKAGVPVKNIVFKFRKNEGVTQNADIKQSAKDGIVSATKNKEAHIIQKADGKEYFSPLSINVPSVSEPKQEESTFSIKNEANSLSKSRVLSHKGIETVEKQNKNSNTISDDVPKTFGITRKSEDDNAAPDENGTDDALLKQGTQKPVKTNVKAKNTEQGFYMGRVNEDIDADREIKGENRKSESPKNISPKQSGENDETYSVHNNSIRREEKQTQKEYVSEDKYPQEEIKIQNSPAQENIAKNQSTPLVQQELNSSRYTSNEVHDATIRNIEHNTTIHRNQTTIQKTPYNSTDIRTANADEFAAVTHEYMRTRTKDNGTVRIVLQPEELGTVTVQYAVRNNEAHLGVQVENQNAKNIIESQLGSLREQFVKQGVHLEKIEVSVKKESEHYTNNNSQTFSNNERGGTTSQQEQESRQAFIRSFRYATEARKAQTTNYTNSAFNRLFNTNR